MTLMYVEGILHMAYLTLYFPIYKLFPSSLS